MARNMYTIHSVTSVNKDSNQIKSRQHTRPVGVVTRRNGEIQCDPTRTWKSEHIQAEYDDETPPPLLTTLSELFSYCDELNLTMTA